MQAAPVAVVDLGVTQRSDGVGAAIGDFDAEQGGDSGDGEGDVACAVHDCVGDQLTDEKLGGVDGRGRPPVTGAPDLISRLRRGSGTGGQGCVDGWKG